MIGHLDLFLHNVSALAAEWIEIERQRGRGSQSRVSALAAEWIEITKVDIWHIQILSPPSRRSGLKWRFRKAYGIRNKMSPPSRRSGLKCEL